MGSRPKGNDGDVTEESQSILAVSIPEADDILSYVRRAHDGEVPPVGVTAHITLLYPWMPPDQIDQEAVDELASLCAGFPSLDYSLRIGPFDGGALLLAPEDSSPFVRMTEAMLGRWSECPHHSGEHGRTEPHVSLAYGDEQQILRLAAQIRDQVPVSGRCASIDPTRQSRIRLSIFD